MATSRLNETQQCVTFFQERILRMIEYWRDHEAVQTLKIAVLDREREAILKVISLGLDYEAAWCVVQPLIVTLTPYMERRGYWEAWNFVLRRAIAVAQKRADAAAETTLTALLARLYQRQNQPQAVIHHYRRVIRLAKQTDNPFERARACSNLGYLYIEAGHPWRSEVLSCHALTIFETLESEHGRAHTHNHLGLLYIRQERWAEAKDHLVQACHLWQGMGDDHYIMYGYSNLGALHLEIEEPHQALVYLQDALSYTEQSGEEAFVAQIYLNIGFAHWQLADYDQARAYTGGAERLARRFANAPLLALVGRNYGSIDLSQGHLAAAARQLNQALQTYRRLSDYAGQVQVLAQLIACAMEAGDEAQAATHLHTLDQMAATHLPNGISRKLTEQLAPYRRRLAGDSGK